MNWITIEIRTNKLVFKSTSVKLPLMSLDFHDPFVFITCKSISKYQFDVFMVYNQR